MKEYSCKEGHQFNHEDAKYFLSDRRPLCPYCWPNGFMKSKQPQQEKPAEAYLQSQHKDASS